MSRNVGSKAKALEISPTLIVEKYRPFARHTSWTWWVHFPGEVNSIGEGPTEARAWQAAVDTLTGRR